METTEKEYKFSKTKQENKIYLNLVFKGKLINSYINHLIEYKKLHLTKRTRIYIHGRLIQRFVTRQRDNRRRGDFLKFENILASVNLNGMFGLQATSNTV